MALEPMDVIPNYVFWRDGCQTMAKNVCEVIRLAGEPVTRNNIVAFVNSLPRSPSCLASQRWQMGYCCECLRKAFDKTPESADEVLEIELIEYFLRYFPQRSSPCQEMLIDAFVGILSGIAWEGQ